MTRFVISLVVILLVSPQSASAAERTVLLTVSNMYCEACPYIVKKTLERVAGVSKVSVSFQDKTAVVVFDDEKTRVEDLTSATAKAGFPSEPKS
ncbi:MAG: mercuric transport protein periplasmic component [Rhodospirillales bacterium 69-11]|nr:mercury resistance system periplasmic binding protein MerP [Rhodospirillales bacterium]MBN8925912.1 mercury resistance system periplasmic binding protein MerP [Rhodospirillales bacterium]OJW21261.1 MAG: mercuric transport protein periplasmic component [Rhodospirillales bacterium 69-11]